MPPAIFRCLVCTAFVLGASSALSARIWTVDATGRGDFRDLPAALQVVRPGDLVQLEVGNYSGGTIPHPITITGRGPATRLVGALTASGLNAPGVLVIRSLTLARPALLSTLRYSPACVSASPLSLEVRLDYPVGGLRFSRCSTPIHVSQVTAESFLPDEHARYAGGTSLIADDCAQLSLVDSTFRPLGALGVMCICVGNNAVTCYPQIVVDAAQINGSFAVIDRCIFEGGHGQKTGAFCSGGPSVGYPGFRGGDGLQLSRTSVVLHASVCKGGIGGDNHKFAVGNGTSCGYPCFPPTAGGNGIRIFDSVQAPITELELFASAIVGADGGRNVDPASCPPPYYPMQGRAGAAVMGALRSLRNETYGLPMLQLSRELQLGASAAVRVDASGTGPIAVYLGTRWIPLRWSGTVGGAVLDPTTGVHFLLGVTHARGAVPFALDRDPALLGFPLFFQGVQLDPLTGLVRLGPVIGDAVRG